jgi:hypothetical protein
MDNIPSPFNNPFEGIEGDIDFGDFEIESKNENESKNEKICTTEISELTFRFTGDKETIKNCVTNFDLLTSLENKLHESQDTDLIAEYKAYCLIYRVEVIMKGSLDDKDMHDIKNFLDKLITRYSYFISILNSFNELENRQYAIAVSNVKDDSHNGLSYLQLKIRIDLIKYVFYRREFEIKSQIYKQFSTDQAKLNRYEFIWDNFISEQTKHKFLLKWEEYGEEGVEQLLIDAQEHQLLENTLA